MSAGHVLRLHTLDEMRRNDMLVEPRHRVRREVEEDGGERQIGQKTYLS